MDPSFCQLHALVIPFPAQGHINPLLYFSTQLALRGATITFVNTEESHQRMLKARCESSDKQSQHGDNLDIRFVAIPDGIPEGEKVQLDTSTDNLFRKLEGIQKQQGLVEELIKSSRSEARPISCLVSDSFLAWTKDLCNNLKIARVVFWTSNATTLYMRWFDTAGNIPSPGKNSRECVGGDITEILSILKEMRSKFAAQDSNNTRSMAKLLEGIGDSASIVVNTFRELEGSILRGVQSPCPVRLLGPLLPREFLDESRGSLLKEESECLQWLDTYPTSSVLYISFGSFVTVASAQLEQLALGIEASNQPFLWVVRKGSEGGLSLPEGFEERTRDRGRLISWAPQLHVLSHPSVGGFLTHCGWNSVLESIYAGIPMVGWPIFADQPINLLLMGKLWRVGVGFKRREGGMMVEKEEVERVVRGVMESEEGRELRRRCRELRDAARRGLREGGASAMELQLFVQDVQRKLEELQQKT